MLGEHHGYRNVASLFDADATSKNIKDAFEKKLKEWTEPMKQSTICDLVVYIAGHGHSNGADTGFICFDWHSEDFPAGLIKYDSLFTNIVQEYSIPADHILFLIDTCHTGSAVQKPIIVKQRELNWSLENKEHLAYHALGSCADDEDAIEIDGNGLFTKCFLDAIDPNVEFRSGLTAFKPGNSEVTTWEIFLKVSDTVAKAAREQCRASQNPQYGSIVDPLKVRPEDGMKHDGQFVFYRTDNHAKHHEKEEKDMVRRIESRSESLPGDNRELVPMLSWSEALRELHRDLGGFRYHHLVDILVASYNRNGLPLAVVGEIINMNSPNIKRMALAQAKQSPSFGVFQVYKHDMADWIRMTPAFLQWCEDRRHMGINPPHCPDYWNRNGCGFRDNACCFDLCKFSHKCNTIFGTWELEDGCTNLLPDVFTGHAILASRNKIKRKMNKPAYRALASSAHDATESLFMLHKKVKKSDVLKGIEDIVGTLGTKLKLIWGFSQCMSALPIVFDLPWPPFILQLSALVRTLTSELLVWILGLSCEFQAGFLPMFTAYLLAMPVLSCVALLSDLFARRRCFCFGKKGIFNYEKGPSKPQEVGWRQCGPGFWETVNDWVLDKGYNPVCTQLFWFFRCREIQDQHYLLADMRVKCYQGEWSQTLPWGVLGVIVFMFGIPLMQLFYMGIYRKHLHSGVHDQELHRNVKMRMGSLYEQYTPAFWWINFFEKLYVLAISGGVVILGEDSIARCLMAILLSAMWILFIT
jgi:hypothetical protein